MCGRFTRWHTAEEIAKRFEVEAAEEFAEARYNIAPSQAIPVITQPDARSVLVCKWGLVPFWSKDPALGNKLINAKAETLAEKPSFKYALEKRRCLIPADGFYEWDKRGKPAQPMYIHRRDDGLFAFAGLWEECKLLDGQLLRTCTIITVPPNAVVGDFHQRMPALLRQEDEAVWLAPATKTKEALACLQPFPDGALEAYAVSTAVNSPAHETAELITRLNALSS